MAQVLTVSTASSTATSAITSTKARVSSNASAVFYSVGSNPTAFTGNCELIPQNSVRYINIQGANNKIAFIAASQAATVTVEPCGTVDSTRTTY